MVKEAQKTLLEQKPTKKKSKGKKKRKEKINKINISEKSDTTKNIRPGF